MQKYLVINCSRTTATTIIFTTIFLFLLIGCTSLFRSAGLTDEQAAQQTAELKSALEGATTAAIDRIQTGLAEGQDLKTTALDASRIFLWKILTAAGATVGVVLNGLLAKWLNTEKKITASMIGAIEHAGDNSVKKAIKNHATAAGVETKLHARVKVLT